MAFDGNGTYNPPSPAFPAISGATIYASDFNTIISDIAAALSTCITLNGQSGVTADIDFGGHRVVHIADAVSAQDAVSKAQAFTNPTFTTTTAEGLVITGTGFTVTCTNTNLTSTVVTVALQPPLDNTSKAASTAFVTRELTAVYDVLHAEDLLKAPIASPALTGIPTAPTAAYGVDTDQLATTHFVMRQAFQSAGTGGALTTTSAVDMTLLANAARMQVITMSVAGKSVFLPDATTLTTGGEIFILVNKGANSFYARKPSGAGVVKVPPNSSALVYLSDNTTAEGVWASGLLTQSQAVALGTIATLNAVDSSADKSITAMSETSALLVWRETGVVVKAAVLTITGPSVSMGTPTTLAGTIYYIKVARLTASTALVVYSDNGSNLRAAVLTITGTNVSSGTVDTVIAAKGSQLSLAVLTATTAVVSLIGTGNLTTAFVLTVTGTSVTHGAEQTLTGTSTTTSQLAVIDATHAVLAYGQTGIYAAVLTVTGTTISFGIPTLLIATYATVYGVCMLSSGTVVACLHMGASTYPNITTGNISGVTVTTGSSVQLDTVAMSNGGALTAISNTQAVAHWPLTGFGKTSLISLSDATVTATTPLVVSAVTNTVPTNTTLASTKTISAYGGVSTFLQAVVTEVL